jgi:Rod binding domain-containing protein
MTNGVSKFDESRRVRRGGELPVGKALKAFSAERFELPGLKPLSDADFGGAAAGAALKPLDLGELPGVKGGVKPLRSLDGSDVGGSTLPRATARNGVDPQEQLQKQAQKLVTQVFLGPLFKQMRASPFSNEMMDGGRGGKAFSSLYDQQLLDRIGLPAGKRLAAQLARGLARRAYGAEQKGTTKDQSPGAADGREGETSIDSNTRNHVASGLRA